MGKHPTELYQLVYEDKIRAMAEPDAIVRLMELLMDMFEGGVIDQLFGYNE
jgi:hypothetical protein